MTSLMDVFVTVKPDMDKFGPEVKKKLHNIDTKAEGSKVAGRFGVGFNGAFGGIAKHSAGLFVGAFAAIKGAQFLGGFINDARESEKVARISAAVIKSTGGVANITATQIGDLATAISNKTGADDEAIQSGANLLATFTNVRNETGKGNDIFNQATQAATDMAAAMNNGVVDAKGLKTANIQLGKALNDPIKGVSALSKVGVSFTADQKKQIKTMVESGNVLGAQKIILGELGKEFGGAAVAAADPLTRLQTIAGNLAEKVGGFLLPSINNFATFVGDKAIPKIAALSDVFSAKVTPKLQEFGGFLQSQVLPRLKDFGGFLKDEVVPRVLEFGNFLTTKVIPAVAGFVSNVAQSLGPAVKDVFGFFKTEVIPRLKEFGGFLGEKVLPTVGELATKLSKNKDFLVPFAAVLVTIVAGLKAWAIAQGILNVVMAANPLGLIIIAIAAFAGGLVWAYKNSDKFREICDKAFRVVAAAGKFMWDVVLKPLFKFMVDTYKAVWLKAQEWSGFMVAAFNALKGPAVAVFRFLVDKMFDFIGNMLSGAAKAFGWVPKLGGPLKTAAAEFGKFRDKTNAALDGIKDEPVNIKVDLAYTAALGAKTKQMKFARGGMMPGYTPGRDVHRFFSPTGGVLDLSGGEPVLRPEAGAVLGKGWVDGINSAARGGGKGGVQKFLGGFARGGVLPNALVPSRRRTQALANAAAGDVDRTGDVMAKAIAKALAASRSNPGLAGVLQFVKSQVGKPYLWGGVGPGGYDCSGLVSAAINTAFGRRPYSRLGATGSMPWGMFGSGPGAFEVGWFKGNPGHTAATVNGVNIESRGGRGVLMGPGARGARSGLFTNRAHVKGFADGGTIGDLPYDTLHNKKRLMKELGIDLFDNGGKWRSGTLAANMSGKTETVIPGEGSIELGAKTIDAIADAVAARPTVFNGRRIDEGFVREAMRR